ncbi:MAG TPA: stage II sporulation protein D [Candidatus Pygmaiobacter gallistercoris]|nr:stage II sporulation protein D [Candidatus Pygmaiobacter gallistercoris]
MKKFAIQLLLFSALTLLLPVATAALCGGTPGISAFTTFLSQSVPTESQSSSSASGDTKETVLPILNSASGEVEQVSLRDFLIGAAASEMPASYQDEAIKAQIIAAHSYALANRDAQLANPDPDLKGAWFAANPDQREGYIRTDDLQNVWGAQYQQYYDRLAALVDEVCDLVVTYQGSPALTTYFAICNGTTETSEAVWGQALPYLVSVDSALDLTSPDCEQTVTFSMQEVYDKLNLAFYSLDLTGQPESWFGATVRDAAGYVGTVEIGGQTIKGTELRQALGLRSADFEVTVGEDHAFTFTTRGYGHGVGLSQYGANALAITGKRYDEILAHYYPGTALAEA